AHGCVCSLAAESRLSLSSGDRSLVAVAIRGPAHLRPPLPSRTRRTSTLPHLRQRFRLPPLREIFAIRCAARDRERPLFRARFRRRSLLPSRAYMGETGGRRNRNSRLG